MSGEDLFTIGAVIGGFVALWYIGGWIPIAIVFGAVVLLFCIAAAIEWCSDNDVFGNWWR